MAQSFDTTNQLQSLPVPVEEINEFPCNGHAKELSLDSPPSKVELASYVYNYFPRSNHEGPEKRIFTHGFSGKQEPVSTWFGFARSLCSFREPKNEQEDSDEAPFNSTRIRPRGSNNGELHQKSDSDSKKAFNESNDKNEDKFCTRVSKRHEIRRVNVDKNQPYKALKSTTVCPLKRFIVETETVPAKRMCCEPFTSEELMEPQKFNRKKSLDKPYVDSSGFLASEEGEGRNEDLSSVVALQEVHREKQCAKPLLNMLLVGMFALFHARNIFASVPAMLEMIFRQIIKNRKRKRRKKLRRKYAYIHKRVFRRKRKLKYWKDLFCDDDNKEITLIGHFSEEPEALLGQPPRQSQGFNIHDSEERRRSFSSRGNLQAFAGTLSSAGFYLCHSNLAQCFSCHRQWNVFELISRNPSGYDCHYPTCSYIRLPQNGFRRNIPSVESDTPGRISDDIGDPPGQQSTYIPPGDVRSETYRLSTFERFPVTSAISKKDLAKAGFFYTGFFDRVKCFACGRTVEQWQAIDSPNELRWHKQNCRFPRGDSCGNIPSTNLFNRLHTTPAARQAEANRPANEQVIEQRDPNTGALIRTVRYPSDLPERIRRTGGTFEIGPGNSITIQSGQSNRPTPPIHIGNSAAPAPPRRWRMANVVTSDHRRFLSNLHLNRELDRLTSFARWPVGRPTVTPATLARSGFFYLGDLDRTQCFSCGGVLRNWTLEDEADEEHRTHFPHCAMVQQNEPRNIPVSDAPETEAERHRNYPCNFPANPHMRNEAMRLEVFDGRWPAGRIAATPEQIAQAGFFFLGERDRVKCWYCNGGLQNWEYNDIPWDEHAKWFPNCQFLLRMKGQNFVHHHLSMNPHLARPIIAKQTGSPLDDQEQGGGNAEPQRSGDIPPEGAAARAPSPPLTIIDPQEEMRKKKERIERIMENSDIVKHVIIMGFSKNLVFKLLEDKIDSGTAANQDDVYDSVAALLDDVMKKEQEQQQEQEQEEEEEAQSEASGMFSSNPSSFSGPTSSIGSSSLGPAMGSGAYNVSSFGSEIDDPMEGNDIYGSISESSEGVSVKEPEDAKSIQDMLSKIEEERMCKICFSNPADMVFIPCSHMCCCMECTQAIRQCPVCRTKIEKAIKTYIK